MVEKAVYDMLLTIDFFTIEESDGTSEGEINPQPEAFGRSIDRGAKSSFSLHGLSMFASDISFSRLRDENPLGGRMWGGTSLASLVTSRFEEWREGVHDIDLSSSDVSSAEEAPGRTCQNPTGLFESMVEESLSAVVAEQIESFLVLPACWMVASRSMLWSATATRAAAHSPATPNSSSSGSLRKSASPWELLSSDWEDWSISGELEHPAASANEPGRESNISLEKVSRLKRSSVKTLSPPILSLPKLGTEKRLVERRNPRGLHALDEGKRLDVLRGRRVRWEVLAESCSSRANEAVAWWNLPLCTAVMASSLAMMVSVSNFDGASPKEMNK